MKFSRILKPLLLIAYCFAISNVSNAQSLKTKNNQIPDWLNKVQIFANQGTPTSILQQAHATVMGWGTSAPLPEDESWLRNNIEELHSLGIKYVSGLSPITTIGNVYNQRPEIADASCLNIHGEKIQLHWYPIGPNEPFYWGCTNNPTWQNYLKEVIERSIHAGADGIHVDEIYGTEHVIWGERGCFCDFCMDGFRDYLKNNFTDNELENEYGIANIDSFHYGEYILNNGYLSESRYIK